MACNVASGEAPRTWQAATGRSHTVAAPHPFVRSIRLTGLTESTHSVAIGVPFMAGSMQGNLTIVRMAAAGSVVKAGDVVVAFDSQDQEQFAFEQKAKYEDLVQQIARTRAEQEAARVKDETALVQADDAVKKYELEAVDRQLVSRIEAEKDAQKLEEARATLEALRLEQPLHREAARAGLRVLEIQRDRARTAMEHAQENVRRMVVRSPIDGLVTPKLRWNNQGPVDVREGDQLWPGAPVLAIVSQAGMRVRAKVSQADADAIREGQSAVVQLDSYPGESFRGRVEHIGPTAMTGSFSERVRVFTVLVAIDRMHPRLLPDLSAAVDVEVERVEAALTVPRDAIVWRNNRPSLSVRQSAGTDSRDVVLGPANDLEVIVTRGVRAGEVVER